MSLTYPRIPGLIVRVKLDTTVYTRGDIAILCDPQPRNPKYLHLAWPTNHPRVNRSGIGVEYQGENFTPLFAANIVTRIREISDLIVYANKQKPILLVKYAEDLPDQKEVPAPTSNLLIAPPPPLYFYRPDVKRTLTNDYLKKGHKLDKK